MRGARTGTLTDIPPTCPRELSISSFMLPGWKTCPPESSRKCGPVGHCFPALSSHPDTVPNHTDRGPAGNGLETNKKIDFKFRLESDGIGCRFVVFSGMGRGWPIVIGFIVNGTIIFLWKMASGQAP